MSFDQHGVTAEFRLELLDLRAHDEGTVVHHPKNTLLQSSAKAAALGRKIDEGKQVGHDYPYAVHRWSGPAVTGRRLVQSGRIAVLAWFSTRTTRRPSSPLVLGSSPNRTQLRKCSHSSLSGSLCSRGMASGSERTVAG